MCNLHDISWGNRETSHKSAIDTQRNLEQFRALYLIIWLSINTVYGYSLIYLNQTGESYYILLLTSMVSVVIIMKLFCSFVHLIYDCCSRVKVTRQIRKEIEGEDEKEEREVRLGNLEESKDNHNNDIIRSGSHSPESHENEAGRDRNNGNQRSGSVQIQDFDEDEEEE